MYAWFFWKALLVLRNIAIAHHLPKLRWFHNFRCSRETWHSFPKSGSCSERTGRGSGPYSEPHHRPRRAGPSLSWWIVPSSLTCTRSVWSPDNQCRQPNTRISWHSPLWLSWHPVFLGPRRKHQFFEQILDTFENRTILTATILCLASDNSKKMSLSVVSIKRQALQVSVK